MALIVETGDGIPNADSYAPLAWVDAYWTNRDHDPRVGLWSAAQVAQREGAIREATAYLDATFGPFYLGQRMGRIQGLLWPRSLAMDEAGFPLPPVPDELLKATAELAIRANAERLSSDIVPSERLVIETSEKIGPIAETIKYAVGTVEQEKYGIVGNLLAGILNGTQPYAPGGGWHWR